MPTIAELLAAQGDKDKAKAEPAPGPAPAGRFIPQVTPQVIPSVASAAIPKIAPKLSISHTTQIAKSSDLPEWATIRNQKGELIKLDEDQIRAVELAITGKSFVLIGKAGTGKTTTMQAINLALLQHSPERIYATEYRIKGEGKMTPGISICVVAFSNRASNNIRNKCQSHPDLKPIMNYNVTTLHNALEYTVEFYEDPETGKTKRRYFPQKDELNKMDISILEVEEGSTIAVGDGSIWDEMYKALPNDVQVIVLGDPNQLPPVGGKPLIAYAMRDLPMIELTNVHRQALDNPIIAQALNCLEGKAIEQAYDPKTDSGVRLIDPAVILKKANPLVKLSAYEYTAALTAVIERLMELGKYDPTLDIVLCPNNKVSGAIVNTHEINAHIASHLAKQNDAEVYEIKAGFNTVYIAIGDKVMVDKYEGIVKSIRHNGGYIGPMPKPCSKTLDYFGHEHGAPSIGDLNLEGSTSDYTALDIDALITTAAEDAEQEKTRAASHIVAIELEDGTEVLLSSAGNFGQQSFSLGYAISVHKAQGSEWRNAIVALHESQGSRSLLYRELLYTGMTRAINRLDIFAQDYLIPKVVKSPRIKGNSIADKLEYFASGYLDLEVPIVPPKSMTEVSYSGE